MPLVITDDNQLCFLVDTGASYSVLLREAYDRCKVKFTSLGKNDYLLGMIGDAQHIFMVNGTISLGGKEYTDEFGVLETSDAMRNVQILTGYRIDGALGISFLRKYGMNLNFHTMEMTDEPVYIPQPQETEQ